MENHSFQTPRSLSPSSSERLCKSTVGISVLESEVGTETFLMLESPPNLDLPSSWKSLEATYLAVMHEAGLDFDSEIFVRLHVSDSLNQIPWLRSRISNKNDRGLFALVGQAPLQRNKIALEAYHMKCRGPKYSRRLFQDRLVCDHGSYQRVWASLHPDIRGIVAAQTTDLLHQLEGFAQRHGGVLSDNLLRTWFYVRDIDTNYAGLVEARRALFERHGMTAATHFVTSTGIAGEMHRYDDLVAMDALWECGLDPAQIRFMTAKSHLCPTYQYGVTFERGTRVTYGDRSHFYISGTASIDKDGRILHEGNLDRQIDRTLENIEVLLSHQGAHLSDLKQAVVYLRDPSDGAKARTLLTSLLPQSVPFILVEGRVCRPGWLVEIEGIAGSISRDARFNKFF